MGFTGSIWALALVLSHVFLLPALYLTWKRRLAPEASLIVGVLIASTLFHMCQVELFCFWLDLHALQLTDHFMVYTALLWFSLYAIKGVGKRLRISIVFAVMAIELPIIATYMGKLVDGAIVIAATIIITTVVFLSVWHRRGRPKFNWSELLVAVLAIGIGVVLHVVGGDYGENWLYPAAHTAWHITAMTALYYFVKVRSNNKKFVHFYESIEEHDRARAKKDTYVPSPKQESRRTEFIASRTEANTRKKPPRIEFPEDFAFDFNETAFL